MVQRLHCLFQILNTARAGLTVFGQAESGFNSGRSIITDSNLNYFDEINRIVMLVKMLLSEKKESRINTDGR